MNKQTNKIFIKSAQAYIVLALSRQRQEDCKNHFFQLISGRAFWAAARVVSKAGWWCGLGESQRHGQGSAGAWLAQVRPRGQLQPQTPFSQSALCQQETLGKELGKPLWSQGSVPNLPSWVRVRASPSWAARPWQATWVPQGCFLTQKVCCHRLTGWSCRLNIERRWDTESIHPTSPVETYNLHMHIHLCTCTHSTHIHQYIIQWDNAHICTHPTKTHPCICTHTGTHLHIYP